MTQRRHEQGRRKKEERERRTEMAQESRGWKGGTVIAQDKVFTKRWIESGLQVVGASEEKGKQEA